MADSTDLKLRIVPELDESAKRKVQDELDKFKSTVPVVPSGGGTGKGGGGSRAPQIKEENVAYNDQGKIISGLTAQHKQLVEALVTERKANELNLRLKRTAANDEIELLRQKGATNQITLADMNQGILEQQAIIEQAEASARAQYAETVQALGILGDQYNRLPKEIVNAQQGVYHSTRRLNNGMDSFSDSVQKITSQTKNANLAFMNFGRVVQDAPFGLIGIANNIDPLLVTFSNLSNEIDVTTGKMRGFGGAISMLGKQLLGPAGIIFILGSLIPSALLVFQKYQRDASKESNILAEAIKRVTDEFARLAGEAASKRGIAQVNKELNTTTQTLEAVSQELAKIEEQIERQVTLELSRAATQTNTVVSASEIRKRLEEQNKEQLFGLRTAKQALEQSKERLSIEEQDIRVNEVIADVQEKRGIAESLRLDREKKQRKELFDLEVRALDEIDSKQADLMRKRESLNELLIDLQTKILESLKEGRIEKELVALYDQIERRIEKLSTTQLSFIDRSLEQQALLRIAYENNLYLAQDENLTYEQRQKYFDIALGQRRSELALQKQSLETQLDQENEEEKKIPIRVQLIQLGQELNLVDRQNLEFARKRADAEFDVWMARQQAISDLREQLRVFESESASSLLGDLDIDDSVAQARFSSATEWIDRQAEYEIEKALYVGDRIKALALEKDLFIAQQRRTYIDQGYDAEVANEMAISDAKKEFAISEVQLRKEVNQELFAAIGEFAGQALTAIFGDNKEVAIAQVVIDTLMGVQKIWSQAGLNPVVGGLASAALIAKGVTSIRKISQTEVGSSGISADNQSPTFVTSQDSYEIGNSRLTRRTPPLISQNMANSTASMLTNPMMGNGERISITANVDRRGLAIAVRDGERAIRSQQFDYK
jgi:hypothetical protein